MKKLVTILVLIFITTIALAQAKKTADINDRIKFSQKFNVNSITEVVLINLWTNRNAKLSKNGILYIKNLLKNSYIYTYGPLLKPGHLYMKIKSADSLFDKYEIYMYETYIYFDSVDYNTASGKPIGEMLTIRLTKPIKWDKLYYL